MHDFQDSNEFGDASRRLQAAFDSEMQRREKFYTEFPDDVKAEFINGKVFVHPPSQKRHSDAVASLLKILSIFAQLEKLGWAAGQKVLTALTRNDYEPDVLFFEKKKSDLFKKGQWKYPPPDFVVEVLSDSTEGNDRGVKFNDYAAHGVREYWIIDPVEQSVEQYFLKNGRFELYMKSHEGRIESRVVQGFSIEIRAIFDEAANLAAIQSLFQK